MRIALIASPWFPVPPVRYGGKELVVDLLARELAATGHEVTIVGVGDGHPHVSLVTTFEAPATGLGTGRAATIEALHGLRAAERVAADGSFDVVHDHSLLGPVFAERHRRPTIVTCHGAMGGSMQQLYREFPPSVHPVAISASQRGQAPEISWLDVVHNGVDVTNAPFVEPSGDYVAFLGRMGEAKGARVAIEAARRAEVPLLIAARRDTCDELEYFDAFVRPHLGRGVEWLGEVDQSTKWIILGGARALLFPVAWEEPFGLVVIEAMATGTPTIAFGRGAVPEIVDHASTGLVVHDTESMAAAIGDILDIDRRVCRAVAAERFSSTRMAGRYLDLYGRIADHR